MNNLQAPIPTKYKGQDRSGLEILFVMDMFSLGIPLKYYVHKCTEKDEQYMRKKYAFFVALCLTRLQYVGLPFRFYNDESKI